MPESSPKRTPRTCGKPHVNCGRTFSTGCAPIIRTCSPKGYRGWGGRRRGVGLLITQAGQGHRFRKTYIRHPGKEKRTQLIVGRPRERKGERARRAVRKRLLCSPGLACDLLHRPGKPAGVEGSSAAPRPLAGDLLHRPGKPAGVGFPHRCCYSLFFRSL